MLLLSRYLRVDTVVKKQNLMTLKWSNGHNKQCFSGYLDGVTVKAGDKVTHRCNFALYKIIIIITIIPSPIKNVDHLSADIDKFPQPIFIK